LQGVGAIVEYRRGSYYRETAQGQPFRSRRRIRAGGLVRVIVVTECANCVLGEAFDCPEIAKLGCDHDLAGYPVIIDRVDAEFRGPHTIAKGDDFCDFMFYRKGTAPDTAHRNK
jgi:hypothetical protein